MRARSRHVVPGLHCLLATLVCVALIPASLGGGLDEAFEAGTDSFVGVVAGCQAKNVRWIGAHGPCRIEPNAECHAQSIMRIASITKPMTAVAILQLHEAGRLDLDSPISKYLPDYPHQAGQRITVRHLLHHTSGIGGYASAKEAESKKEYPTLADAAEVFAHRPLEFDPGTGYSYTTYGYVVLGMIIEAASDKSYEEYLRERIWEPAGMKQTSVEKAGVATEGRSELFRKPKRGRVRYAKPNNLSNRVPGGGVQSTVADLMRFGQALLDGTLLSKAALERMWSYPDVERGENNPYAMGWYVYAENSSLGRIVGHSGEQTGASGQLMLLPDSGVVVAVLSNTSNSWRSAIELSMSIARGCVATKSSDEQPRQGGSAEAVEGSSAKSRD